MKNSIFVEPQYFVNLFEYDAWASERLLSVLEKPSFPQHERAMELMSHLLRSQAVWINRAEEAEAQQIAIWHLDSLDECKRRRADNTEKWLRLLRGSAAGDFARQITYTNSKGQSYTSDLRDILTHVINHGSHHRAQISQLLRQGDVAPPPLDFIFYCRDRK